MKKTRKTQKDNAQEKDNVLRLDGSGLKDNDPSQDVADKFRRDLNETQGIPVVLDISAINTIYSPGIGIVVGLYKECQKQNRGFEVEVKDENIYNLFKMLKLDKVFTIRKGES